MTPAEEQDMKNRHQMLGWWYKDGDMAMIREYARRYLSE